MFPRLAESVELILEYEMVVTAQRKPTPEILVVTSILLEPERAVIAQEHIDAMVGVIVVEGCDDDLQTLFVRYFEAGDSGAGLHVTRLIV
jgi:hypothetical protein